MELTIEYYLGGDEKPFREFMKGDLDWRSKDRICREAFRMALRQLDDDFQSLFRTYLIYIQSQFYLTNFQLSKGFMVKPFPPSNDLATNSLMRLIKDIIEPKPKFEIVYVTMHNILDKWTDREDIVPHLKIDINSCVLRISEIYENHETHLRQHRKILALLSARCSPMRKIPKELIRMIYSFFFPC